MAHMPCSCHLILSLLGAAAFRAKVCSLNGLQQAPENSLIKGNKGAKVRHVLNIRLLTATIKFKLCHRFL